MTESPFITSYHLLSPLIIADRSVSEAKCRIAETLAPGAVTGLTVGSSEKEMAAVAAVHAGTDNWGANVVFECAGNHKAAELTTKVS